MIQRQRYADSNPTEAIFYRWRNAKGEANALADMKRVFGQEFPDKGLLLAWRTHSRWPDTWLLNAVLRIDIQQGNLF